MPQRPPREVEGAGESHVGGHLGLFMGTEVLREFWPGIFTDNAGCSRRSAPAAQESREAVSAQQPLMSAR